MLDRNLGGVVTGEAWAFGIPVTDSNEIDFDFTGWTGAFTIDLADGSGTVTGTISLSVGLISLSLTTSQTSQLNKINQYSIKLTGPATLETTWLNGNIGPKIHRQSGFGVIYGDQGDLQLKILDLSQSSAAAAAFWASEAEASVTSANIVEIVNYIEGLLSVGVVQGGMILACALSTVSMELDVAPSGGPLVVTFTNRDTLNTIVTTFNDGSTEPDSTIGLPLVLNQNDRFIIEVTTQNGAEGLSYRYNGLTTVL
jgi:hypothetical protein